MALLYFSVIILALILSHPIRYKIWKTRIENLLAKIKISSTFLEEREEGYFCMVT